MTRISLERIAARLQWLQNCGQPKADIVLAQARYREALLFIQAVSFMPGGLEHFGTDFFCHGSLRRWVEQLPEKHGAGYQYAIANNPIPIDSGKAGELAWYLKRWCEMENPQTFENVTYPEFDKQFPRFLEALCIYMDSHAEAELSRTASTRLRDKVIEELEFARTSNPPIPMMFVADTRQGKTTAIQTYCRAWPGRARLVTVPESDNEREMYESHAEAFNVPFTPATTIREIKSRVQFVVRNTGLFILYDEAHGILPRNFSQDTPPQRLDWIRAQIIDRQIPCAFFCTPQSHRESLTRYASKTHRNLEQFWGRLPAPVIISGAPSHEDLMAVARAKFAEFSEPVLGELCDAAEEKAYANGSHLTGESGFKIIDLAGARARYLARKRGSSTVTLRDMLTATEWAGANPVRANTISRVARPSPKGRANTAEASRVGHGESLSLGFKDPSRAN